MRKHTCHLDLRQISLYVTIGQKNWVQKLIDNQKKLLDSHKEKFLDSSNQPNQTQKRNDRSGQPDNKHEMFVEEGEKSLSREIKEKASPWSREIKETSVHEELYSSDRSGQPDIAPGVIRAQTNLKICLKKFELSKLTIDQGNLINMKSHHEQLLKYIVRLRRITTTMS